jgi:hypothetical protein
LYGCEKGSRTKGILQIEDVWHGVLRFMFGPKSENLKGDCRKFHKKELHKLYPSSNIIRKTKSRKIRGAGNTNVWKRTVIYTKS